MLRLVRDKTRPAPDAWPAWPRGAPEHELAQQLNSQREPSFVEQSPPAAAMMPAAHHTPDFLDDPPRRSRGFFRRLTGFVLTMCVGAAGATAFYAWQPAALDTIAASARTYGKPLVQAVVASLPSSASAPEVPSPAPPPAATATMAAAPATQQQPAGMAARPQMPDAPMLMILVRTTFAALHHAATTGNFAVLRDLAAPTFQRENTAASLSASFGKLAGRDLDLSRARIENPGRVREPWIDNAGRLRILGYFPTSGSQVNFELVFELVDGRWQVFGIGADEAERTADSPPQQRPPLPVAGRVPDDATLVTLIRSSVLALNQANATGNYSVLLDASAPGFREANNVAKLAEAFAALREREIDLSPVAVIEPKLFRPPTIDDKGYLRLIGFFPSQPEQVNFDLAFDFTTRGWQLFGVGLNTSREEPAARAPMADDQNAGLGAAAMQQQASTAGQAVSNSTAPAAEADHAPIPDARPTAGQTITPVLPRLRPPHND